MVKVMGGKKCKVTVEILGEQYALKGDGDADRVLRIAAFLDERMKKIASACPGLAPVKVAVLAALNIVDEHLHLEDDYKQLVKMLKEEKK